MKRWMQKLISILMSLMLILSFGITAFAENQEPEPAMEDEAEEGVEEAEEKVEEKAEEVVEEVEEVTDEVEINGEDSSKDGPASGTSYSAADIEVAEEPEGFTVPQQTNPMNPDEGGGTRSLTQSNTDHPKGTDADSPILAAGLTILGGANPDDGTGDWNENETGPDDYVNDTEPDPVDDSDETDSDVQTAGEVEFIRVEETGSTSITYGETELTGDKDARCLLEYSEEGKLNAAWGWAASDGMLSLANCDEAKDITVKEGELTIQAAGLNRINTLVSDSVVNIIGSGILLLEDAKLDENGEVNLLTNDQYADTGVEGSVGVFLRQKDAPGETYKLMNGPVSAILDGIYTIPSGVNLIIPDGSSVIMNSAVATKKEGEDNRYQYYSGDSTEALKSDDVYEENAAILKVSNGASLTVEKGAEIRMIATESVVRKTEKEESGFDYLTPMIELESGAKLSQKGKLTFTGDFGGFVVDKSKGESDPNYTVVVGDFKEAPFPIAIQNPELKLIYNKFLADGKKPGDSVSYEELLAAWNAVSEYQAKAGKVFIIRTDEGTKYVKPYNPYDSFKFSDQWTPASLGNPYTGTGLMGGSMAVTGVGLVLSDLKESTPGKNADGKPTFISTGSTTILPEKLAAKTQEPIPWRVVVTENPERGTWTLSVYAGDVRITDLGVATVRARFKYNLPDGWDGKNIYVVFLDKNGNLRAIPAAYNAVTGELAFDSNLVGEFVVVTFNYKGELYSKNFYTELEKLDAVKHLINLHSGKAG